MGFHSRPPVCHGEPDGAGASARAALLVAAFTVVPLAVLMLMQVRSGRWGDVDASQREERPLLFAVAGLGLLALATYLALTQPISPLLRGLLSPLVLLAGAALVNHWVKASLHVAFAVLAAATLIMLGHVLGWVLVPVIPALGWSRLVLGRHSIPELVAGALLGLAATSASVSADLRQPNRDRGRSGVQVELGGFLRHKRHYPARKRLGARRRENARTPSSGR